MIRTPAVLLAALCACGCSQAFRFTEDAGQTVDAGDAGSGDAGQGDAGNDAGTDAGTGDGGVCALPGACECDDDQGCGAARPRCATDKLCVECLVHSDCGADAGRCDAKTRRCTTACTSNGQCTVDIRNHCEDGHCVVCEPFPNLCPGVTPVCAESVGFCVACNADSACPAATPRCDRRFGTCVKCLAAADCAPTEYCAVATGTCALRP